MKSYKKTIAALGVCAIASAGALGCNTFRGAGQDIQQGGRAVENSAQNAQDERAVRTDRQHTIMAISDSGGSISPEGGTNVPYGSRQTYRIQPYTGYRVQEVFVDGKSLGPVNRHTFDNVTSSHTISVRFAAYPN